MIGRVTNNNTKEAKKTAFQKNFLPEYFLSCLLLSNAATLNRVFVHILLTVLEENFMVFLFGKTGLEQPCKKIKKLLHVSL
jgi:hypothetical protein